MLVWDINCIQSCYTDPLKRATWELTLGSVLAQDTTVHTYENNNSIGQINTYEEQLLTLAAKRRRIVTAIGWRFLSVRPYDKGRLRESTHLRITSHQGRVVTLSPAQWYNSVQLWLPFCALLINFQCSDSVNRQWLSSA